MKLVRFEDEQGEIAFGDLVDERTARLATGSIFPQPRFGNETCAVRRLLAPVVPPNIFALGRNYAAHVAETGARMPEQPLIFIKATTSLQDPEGPIRLPASAPNEVDFEAELALVIGRVARNVAPETALDCVLGYTCANDVSARDCQRNDKQWTRAKGFDTFCPLGPWIIGRDALDPDNTAIRSMLNGAVMQDANTNQMIHKCGEIVSYLSQQFTLLPGTVILTGTPAGVGFARDPAVYLQPGDRIEIEIPELGRLGNPVVAAD